MSKITISSAANAFGSGKTLIGLECRGSRIVNATRKFMTLENGKVIERKGNYITHEMDDSIEIDNTFYQTDEL